MLPGSDPKAKAMLLLGHLDVVEAKREDWTRDPFTLIEENGYFYGRGVADDEGAGRDLGGHHDAAEAGRLQTARTIKMALTCGEETPAPSMARVAGHAAARR